jgi:hypothetical protein
VVPAAISPAEAEGVNGGGNHYPNRHDVTNGSTLPCALTGLLRQLKNMCWI